MPGKVYISGLGIISALGMGLEENLAALRSARSGIAHPRFLDTIHKNTLVTGEVKFSNAELIDQNGLKKAKPYSRTLLLGMAAAREAVKTAGLSHEDFAGMGLINGTSVGGMDISEQHYAALKNGDNLPFRDAFSGHYCGASTEAIADELGIKAHLSTISTACSSSANAIMQAGRLIKAGKLDCVLAGGTDALTLFTLNGFNSLKILDPEWCKPFDLNRQGLNLGEGAAYLVLESEERLRKRGAKVLAELKGYGNANDAYHQTASSPEGKGAWLAMKKALEIAGMEPQQLDYVNAHGTGTHNNDLSESTALQLLFGDHIPDYSSTKAFTGHTLGGAGAIEAVFSILALQHNLKFGSLNIAQPMEVLPKPPLSQLITNDPVRSVLSNSFGFGGNCTSLLFSR